MGRGFVDSVGCRVKNRLGVVLSAALQFKVKATGISMIESTAPPACPHVYEVETRFFKVLPKGQRGCVHELLTDVSVQMEKRREFWVASVEIGDLYDWGEGESEKDAVNALVCNMGEFKLELKKSRSSLHDQSLRVLTALEDLVGQWSTTGTPVHANCSKSRPPDPDEYLDDEPVISARYDKVLRKGQYCCGHELKDDIKVTIEQSEDCWTASWDLVSTFEWGAGITEQQAINDLVSCLGEYRHWLMDNRERLADGPTRDLELIEELVT